MLSIKVTLRVRRTGHPLNPCQFRTTPNKLSAAKLIGLDRAKTMNMHFGMLPVGILLN